MSEMETEVILLILSIIFIIIILIVIFSMIIWLLLHKKELKAKTDSLNDPLKEPREQSEGYEGPDPNAVKGTESMSSLRSSLSDENMEQIRPQTLMTWNEEDKEKDTDSYDPNRSIRSLDLDANKGPDKASSLEIRKIESINYITYVPPLKEDSISGSRENGSDDNEEPTDVLFESDPQIGPTLQPIEEEEFTLEEI